MPEWIIALHHVRQQLSENYFRNSETLQQFRQKWDRVGGEEL